MASISALNMIVEGPSGPVVIERLATLLTGEDENDMWYIYGEAVIDHLLQTARANEIDVYSDSLGLSPSEVRRELSLGPTPPIFITNEPPLKVINLDDYVLLPDGRVRDLPSGTSPVPPLRLLITSSDLSPGDADRIERLLQVYPEIQVDSLEATKMALSRARRV